MVRKTCQTSFATDEITRADADSEVRPITRLARNSLFIFLARAMEIGGTLLTAALLTRYLQPERFGLYTWIWALVFFFQPLINYELNTILTREIAQTPQRGPALLGASLIIKWALMAVFVAAVICMVVFMDLSQEIRIALIIALLSELAVQHSMLFSGVFLGCQRMEYETILSFVFKFLQIAGLSIAVLLKWPFAYLFAITLGANVIRLAMALRFQVLRFFAPRLAWDKLLIRYLLQEAGLVTIGSFLTSLSFRIDIYFLKWLSGEAAVGLFHLPHMVIMQLQILPAAMVTALFPLLALWQVEDPVRLRDAARFSTKMFIALGGLIAIPGMLFAPWIVRALGGAAFTDAARSFRILIWCAGILFLNYLATFLLIALKLQRKLIVGAIVSLVINAVGDWLLIPRLGHVGAAWGTLLGYSSQIVIVYYFLNKGLPGFHLIRSVYVPLTCVGLSLATTLALEPHSSITAASIGTGVLFASGALLQIVSREERAFVMRAIRSRRRRLPEPDGAS